MLNTLIRSIKRWRKPANPGPRVIARNDHNISRRDISRAALTVMKRLQEAGFQAYIVGGGVRDLLLGKHPKDFDVATDATPEEAKALFRGSRIVGRRFRILHARIGREVIEVTTFRGHHEDGEEHEALQSEQGMLLRDNVYGDLESDAMRRDFTINALYYTTDGFAIHDYTGGVQDIKERLIRTIGDPATRYKEDPVRMLRAVRFAAKLEFKIEDKTAAPLANLAPLLRNIAPARLFDEVLKLLMSGHGERTFELLHHYQLWHHLFPNNAALLEDPVALALTRLALRNTDQRIRDDLRVTPAFLYAALLWPAVIAEQQHLESQGTPPVPALAQAAQKVTSSQLAHTAIPKRFSIPMREIWDLQLRLPQRNGNRAQRLSEHPRFRAAYDFLLLREESGELAPGLGQWWAAFQQADEEGRQEMTRKLQRGNGSRRRRGSRGGRRRRPRTAE
ncbi:polynucleotide adenylyltransferase PcnB [Microbulbifer thermotolerans]|uniref:polynucleotide adenylyltransferase PcnB n=1 Tax=Microbulbifer thermotolerans TaxID=252514 RepID=UPI002248DC7C|nr:polynucleotide adenylyltransferase PcnB [Microbulbifer thermotolerans]MCX2779219.1 polynucleotide adenylyltransferase PcnB [Microbulbifer thermotolerans]MCX2793551.1 polynucleotide adenylyltransferase PcnB [Microbulbifer thermotolerans]MCX2803643.1 polynucleotide adenylyltransferase PcnB [Microbulbifer thermotolerans]MCX2830406.1 polynucleotide adenylyltransferase PcnB [Microbulbifer thermotolerans]